MNRFAAQLRNFEIVTAAKRSVRGRTTVRVTPIGISWGVKGRRVENVGVGRGLWCNPMTIGVTEESGLNALPSVYGDTGACHDWGRNKNSSGLFRDNRGGFGGHHLEEVRNHILQGGKD
jgi:hypothetical protein